MSGKTKIIRAMGVPRSGNHPIIKFVCENAGPRGYVHFNLCKPLQNPLDAYLTTETREEKLRAPSAEGAAPAYTADSLEEFDVVVFSYEDLYLDAHHALSLGISAPFEDRIDANLYITRSLPNWIASWMQQRLKKLKKNPDSKFNLEDNPFYITEKVIRVFRNWLLHLREADIAIAAKGRDGNVGAVFDSFYGDPRHRAQILDHLEMPHRTLELPGLTHYGGGSSFTGVGIKDAAQLAVQDRWLHFKDNPYFEQMVRLFWIDPEVRQLCQRHFPRSSMEIEAYLTHSGPLAEAS